MASGVHGHMRAADGATAMLPQRIRQARGAEGVAAGDGERATKEHHADGTHQLLHLLLHQTVL